MIDVLALIALFMQALNEKWGYIWGTAGILWTKAKQEQLEKTTDDNRTQGRKYGSRWIGHMVADCSGLFSWAFKKLGGYMYHGSNTMYLKYCTDKGKLEKGKRSDGKPLKPGTAVFVWNGKTYSHVGLYVGDGNVVEAASTLKGVTTSSVTASKWSHWGELKGVNYSAAPEDEAGKPTLRKGSKGEYVKEAQKLLLDRGYKLPKYGADGDFGSETETAVKQFQKDWGLKQDGVIGPETWKLLESAPVKEKEYSVTVKGLTLSQAKALCDMYPNNSSYKEMS